ncbi:MAG: D-alanyl-D-alanine carboxypeptidase [Candidatus Pacebacteria bacterium]|nr:D-alanyl-D-alanine carboxypeptidase [Candidatus Paceibacterota bacterium]
MNKSNNFLRYVAVISLFGVIGFVFGAINTSPTLANTASQPASVSSTLKTNLYDFSDVTLTGKAAYVFDIANNESIFGKNQESQLPLASITKVGVALLAYEHLNSTDQVTISAKAIATEGESGFIVGERWDVQNLTDFTLMTSSNDGAVALSEAIERSAGTDIVSLLNAQAKKLYLSQTYFVNETGLDSSTASSGTYGSAQDVGALFAYAYETSSEIFAATAVSEYLFENLDGTVYKASNTNKAIGELPGLVFGKTGFTDLAGGNLAIVVESEPGHPFVIVVLGSSVEERFEDATVLVRTILRKLTQ